MQICETLDVYSQFFATFHAWHALLQDFLVPV